MKTQAQRVYGLRHKTGMEYKPQTGFAPMTHKEACTMKRKLMRPLDWELIELRGLYENTREVTLA